MASSNTPYLEAFNYILSLYPDDLVHPVNINTYMRIVHYIMNQYKVIENVQPYPDLSQEYPYNSELMLLERHSQNWGNVIVVSGNIGCGKTTVLSTIETYFKHMHVNVHTSPSETPPSRDVYIFRENVAEWEPYLKRFYKESAIDLHSEKAYAARYNLQQVIIKHFQWVTDSIKRMEATRPLIIVERSPMETLQIFCADKNDFLPHHYTEITGELRVMSETDEWKYAHVVYINTPPEKCLKQVEGRARESEVQGTSSLSLDYLKTIHGRYENLKMPFSTEFENSIHATVFILSVATTKIQAQKI